MLSGLRTKWKMRRRKRMRNIRRWKRSPEGRRKERRQRGIRRWGRSSGRMSGKEEIEGIK